MILVHGGTVSGAGGLGQLMDGSMKMLVGGEVLTLQLVIVALVALADRLSTALRRVLGLGPIRTPAANRPYRLPLPLFDARCRACWPVAAVLAQVAANFGSLDFQFATFFSAAALSSMGRSLAEFMPPTSARPFLRNMMVAAWETQALSALGTLLAAACGELLAVPTARLHAGDGARGRVPAYLLLNALRPVPELVWTALLLIAVGLGPFAGTLALAAHNTGMVGRLFAEIIEHSPPGPAAALWAQG